ncbi:hypothetical protein SOVF_161970, partial [Spinacia oleracea]
ELLVRAWWTPPPEGTPLRSPMSLMSPLTGTLEATNSDVGKLIRIFSEEPVYYFFANSMISIDNKKLVDLAGILHTSEELPSKLAFVVVCDGDFRRMITGCPYLQELAIIFLYELHQLHFTALSIEKIELEFSTEPDGAED